MQAQVFRAYMAVAGAGDPVSKARAMARITKWRLVQQGIAVGRLSVGSRTPVDGVPAWATLEVLHGGFASGALLASAPLSPAELALARSLDDSGGNPRVTLNRHYLSPQGRSELLSALAAGQLAIDLPEQGALPAVAWLLEQGRREQAFRVIDELAPFFDRLRFWPSLRPPAPHGELLQLRSHSLVAERLRHKKTPKQITILLSRYGTWNSLYDRLVALIWSTRAQDEVLRTLSAEFFSELAEILEGVEEARQDDPVGEPGKKSNFQRLLPALQRLHQDNALGESQQAHVAHCMGVYLSKYGEPGGAKLSALRRQQSAFLTHPRVIELYQAMARRLEVGLPADFERLVLPVHEPGHPRLGVPVEVPKALRAKVLACRPGSLEQLLEWGVVSSNEVMAALIPTLSARALAQSAVDEQARSLLELSYQAFAGRRSLLLVNLASQVGLEELPWIEAIRAVDVHTQATVEAALRVCDRVVGLSLSHFPEQPLANPFVRQLQLLRKQAGQSRLVQELAADIFQGHYSDHFVRMAKESCAGLRVSVYGRYYDLPSDAELSKPFAILCRQRSPKRTLGDLSSNGQSIEQSLILTSHNLWALWQDGELERTMAPALEPMAQRCFLVALGLICGESPNARVALERKRRAGAVWRQMLFFLSMHGAPSVSAFGRWCTARFQAASSEPAHARFEPYYLGLLGVLGGERFGSEGQLLESKRLLGWGPW